MDEEDEYRHRLIPVGPSLRLSIFAETLSVYRFALEGYLHVLAARRGERVRAEPFGEIDLDIGVLFGDDED